MDWKLNLENLTNEKPNYSIVQEQILKLGKDYGLKVDSVYQGDYAKNKNGCQCSIF